MEQGVGLLHSHSRETKILRCPPPSPQECLFDYGTVMLDLFSISVTWNAWTFIPEHSQVTFSLLSTDRSKRTVEGSGLNLPGRMLICDLSCVRLNYVPVRIYLHILFIHGPTMKVFGWDSWIYDGVTRWFGPRSMGARRASEFRFVPQLFKK